MKASPELKTKMPKPVSYRDVSNIATVVKNEGTIKKVIHDGVVKEWVGIGWIDIGGVRPGDYLRYPQVLSDAEIKKWNSPTGPKPKKKNEPTHMRVSNARVSVPKMRRIQKRADSR